MKWGGFFFVMLVGSGWDVGVGEGICSGFRI